MLYFERRYEESLAEMRKTLAMNENFARTHVYLENIYLLKGMDNEALAEHLKLAALTGVSFERIASLKDVYVSSGWKGVWRKEIEWALEDSERRYVAPFTVASLYSRIGDKDGAFEWLNKSIEGETGPWFT